MDQRTIAHYEILEEIGAGGMGVVYRARDTRLDREVAVKALPEGLAQDAERLARFEREAKLLASLNHPHIAAIHGLEEADGQPFLILELVEGETLAERITRGPIPVEEALELGRQIAEALEAAHGQGVVHRDLKPANVKVTPEGQVKVLDFGLAKALALEPSDPDFTHSPTLTQPMTRTGIILGTAGYMSPEQARGQEAGKQADIWALGCVLYEMLTGERAFRGATVSDSLAAILERQPDWDALPEATPPLARSLLRRSLEKDANRRLHDIGDARIEIEEVLERRSTGAKLAAWGAVPASRTRLGPVQAIAGLAVLALVAIGSVWVGRGLGTTPDGGEMRRFALTTDELDATFNVTPQISPNGSMVVYPSTGQLWVRELDELQARPLPGTEGASFPFWSPDSRDIAFHAEGVLWRLPIAGGDRTAITDVGELEGGYWGPDDRILIGYEDAIAEVSAGGGDPQNVITIDRETAFDFHHPVLLPDGRSIVFREHRAPFADRIVVWDGSEQRAIWTLSENQVLVDLVYSATGHLIFGRFGGANQGIWALPFALDTLSVAGEPFLISPGNSGPSLSNRGTLTYVEGVNVSGQTGELRWFHRDGTRGSTIGQPQVMMHPDLSPDETRVVVAAVAETSPIQNVWVHHIRGGKNPVSAVVDSLWDFWPTWVPNAPRVAYQHREGHTAVINTVSDDGSTGVERVADGTAPSYTSDGRYLVFARTPSFDRKPDIWYLKVDEPGSEPIRFLETDAGESSPRVSPDGRWVAYESDESGELEIHVRPFPSGDGRAVVSLSGGRYPRWRGDSRELFFWEPNGGITAATLQSIDSLDFDLPVRVLAERSAGLGPTLLMFGFDVSADGQRFVVLTPLGDSTDTRRLILVENWFAEFNQAMAAGQG